MADTESDIVVVGAGAGGAAAAWRLAGHGFSVTCLEQGGWVDPETSPSTSPDWETIRQKSWHPNPNRRGLPIDDPVDDSDSEIKPLYFNGVGGSTVMWSCHIPRFHPSDFRTFSLDGVGDDWPVSYADLAPYYDINERMMGVAGLAGHPAYPRSPTKRMPPVGLSPGAIRVAQAFNRLGWSWWPAEVSLRTDGGAQSCNNCGPCELHCPRRAKGTTDLRYWPQALERGVKLVTSARVVRVETAGLRASGVVFERNGERHRHRAPIVILAANGIGTPRLLLASGPGGLVNRSGLVGRRLMLHPLARVTGIFEPLVAGYMGIAAGAIVSHHFYETDPARGFRRGVKLQGLGSQGPALTALGSLGAQVPWGHAHHRRFAEVFGHAYSISICADDMPDPTNRVILSDNGGELPNARMIYRAPREARQALKFGRARAKEALSEAGARAFIEMERVPEAGFHLMGTARMGTDRETSVVDPFGEAHDCAGLFVVDGATFVTAAAVNPTNTIQALALRAADHIARTNRQRTA